ncbi:MAG: lipid-A-disaccharide synthase, partial [Rickettsiaceae bacterium]|nr:lipid-A-disaccharide synthase [Rickettsiaceae bacterium]
DIIITIDSPGFSTRVTSNIKQFSNAKLVHVVAPSVWAYKPERAAKFAKIYDLLITLLPFEPPYFEKEGLRSVFVGHFIFEQDICDDKEIFRKKYDIKKEEEIICITPGSRKGEVAKHLPIFLDSFVALKEKYNLRLVILSAGEKISAMIQNQVKNKGLDGVIITEGDHFQVYKASTLAIAKSGTNALEIAMHQTPQIICYKVNFISWFYIKMKILVKFANLINIMAGREIIPELLQSKFNSSEILNIADRLLRDAEARADQVENSSKILEEMKNKKGKPSKLSIKEILKL